MTASDVMLGFVIGLVVMGILAVGAITLSYSQPHFICEHTASTTYTAVINATQTVTAVIHSITNSTMTTTYGEPLVCKP